VEHMRTYTFTAASIFSCVGNLRGLLQAQPPTMYGGVSEKWRIGARIHLSRGHRLYTRTIFPNLKIGDNNMNDKTEAKAPAEQTLRQAVDESVTAAIDRGALDASANAAPIALLRRMADVLDGSTDPLTMRYCTPASFTALFDKLGLLPTERQLERTATRHASGSTIVGQSKWRSRLQQSEFSKTQD